MSDNPLALRNVGFAFGDHHVLREISLVVERGEFLAIVGVSGVGKTTLLEILAGHRPPTFGEATRCGAIRTVHQQDGLYPWLTAEENIGLGLHGTVPKSGRREAVAELLTLMQLQGFGRHYPHQLSRGMRQRVELARALAGDAEILIMDEPFSALDYLSCIRLRQELMQVISLRPRTVVMVTHDIEGAAQMASRILIMAGRPANIVREMRISVPHPRPPTHPMVVETVEVALRELGLVC